MNVRTILLPMAGSLLFASSLAASEGEESTAPNFKVNKERLIAALVPETQKSDTFYLASLANPPAPSPSAAAHPASPLVENPGIAKKGNIEFSLFGSGTNDENFEVGTGSAAVSVGFFLADNLQLSVRQNVFFSDGGDAMWDGITRGAIDFHIPIGEVVPFVGANIGYLYGESVDETFVAAPEVGVKWYLRDDAFMFFMAEYEFFFNDTNEVGDSFENGQFIYSLGIGLAF